MAISGIQSQNMTSSYPQSTTVANSSLGFGDGTDAVGTNKSGSLKTAKINDSQNNQFADNNSGDAIDVGDRTKSLDERLTKEKLQKQQSEPSVERSLRMTGIPLYGGVLVSVVKYPDGQSESYDVFTGKRIASTDPSLRGSSASANNAEFGYYSQGLYSGMSAAEVYEKIQQLLGANSSDVSWTLPGSGNQLPQSS
ncbi:hypothetical protein DZA65_01108 [Dickeya dianthicola]|uniref:Uncharacterized protein n=1 Tax=Dickeya dianthicola TaxID=204039 RepID=A0AAP2CYV2_9GAMM|nr:hypothetical protein [Dickeya dianthicola]ATO31998.1 hypothetical protein DDI_0830 [Dickeya dianthicola RNS04.9]AYC18010.1 hypothetical protein DZA65_01108 [Dickeya dianthicola]MBI0439784.1 hypothetical protein [Dickeya dianthicola]MBI0450485.1 hypothetical protein [Dickeya dianthicola]MBI0455051.1 hypothetical protein [Dickeya dianthicola]